MYISICCFSARDRIVWTAFGAPEPDLQSGLALAVTAAPASILLKGTSMHTITVRAVCSLDYRLYGDGSCFLDLSSTGTSNVIGLHSALAFQFDGAIITLVYTRCLLSSKSFGPRTYMTRPPATLPPRLCPHLRQKTESAAYTEPHLTHVDSTLQYQNRAIQSNRTQNQTKPISHKLLVLDSVESAEGKQLFWFLFGRVKKWIYGT